MIHSCRLLLVASCSISLAITVQAQDLDWVDQLGTSASDSAKSVALDGVGGVYVSGSTTGSLGGALAGGHDAWLAHYDSSGTQTWIRQFGTIANELAASVAPDGAGGVYVCGETAGALAGPIGGTFDVWLARYDSDGNRSWIRQFGSSLADIAGAATADGLGGVFVTGSTFGSLGATNAGDWDAWLAHYDSSGTQTWIRQFGSDEADFAAAAASDESGGVYVSGRTLGDLGASNAGDLDGWLAHFDSSGAQVWIRQFGGGNDDYTNAAAPDGIGGVYVAGHSLVNLNPGVDLDVWVAHYDDAGNQTWARQFGTSTDDYLFAAASDGAGGIFIAGNTWGSLGGPSAGTLDAWLARYDSAGNQLGASQWGTSLEDSVSAVTLDGARGAYVCGKTMGSLVGTNAGGDDAWIAHSLRACHGGLECSPYCSPAISNSTAWPGVLLASGSNIAQDNDVTLTATQLPPSSFGFFLTSEQQGYSFPINNSQGALCLGGFIGRYIGPGQIQNSGPFGTFSLSIDLTAMPSSIGFMTADPGETWNFQAWHRDANPSTTSNFTDAVAVTFL